MIEKILKQNLKNNMKKFLMAFMLCLVSIIGASAQNYYGYTTNCLIWNSYYQDWKPIENGQGIEVVITPNGFFVNSSSPQAFKCYNVSDTYINKSGHKQYTADAIDQDGQRCSIRVVFRNDSGCEAPLQIYINYSNISYVYNIVLYQSSYS